VGLLSVLKIIIFSALETHKGPPYIVNEDFIVVALETHKGPPYIFYMTFAIIISSLRDLRIYFVF
jgi:hypothetical protein